MNVAGFRLGRWAGDFGDTHFKKVFFFALCLLGRGGILGGVPQYVVDVLDRKSKSAVWFAGRNEAGEIYTFPGALAGNRIYSWRMMERVGAALGDLRMEAGDCLFITLTSHYKKNLKGVSASWKENRAELPRYLRKLRRMGFRSFIWVREAHEDGGCHVHLVIKKCGQKFYFFQDKKNPAILRLADEALRADIKAAWPCGHVDIQVISSGGAGQYLAKEVGKASHIEDALSRAKKGMATPSDSKKLWASFMSLKEKMRRWGVSRDLIKHMINTTDEVAPETDEIILLPKSVRDSEWFEPITGALEPGSLAFREISALLDSRKAVGAVVWEALKGVPWESTAAVLAGV